MGDQATHRERCEPRAREVCEKSGKDAERGELNHDHAPDLTRRGTDRAQKGRRARPLGDREGDGARDDEE